MNKLNRYYDILGLKPDATAQEVRRAYRELVRVWHPDRFGDVPRLQLKAQEKLKEINEAYRVLKEAFAAAALRGNAEKLSAGAVEAGEPSEPAPPGSANGTFSEPVVLAGIATALSRWLADWPNILLLLLFMACIRFSTVKYGYSLQAIAYSLELLLIPAVMSLAAGSRYFAGRRTRLAYLASMVVVAGYLVVDFKAYQRELQEATFNEEAPTGGVNVAPSSPPWPSPAPGESDIGQSRSRKGGPMAPDAPSAPRSPAAPIVPVAPIVPPASPAR